MTLSRRNALKLGLGAGAFPLLGGFPFPSRDPAAAPKARGRAVLRARALPLSAVRLTGGPPKPAQDPDGQSLRALEHDRMLAYSRQRAGLAPKAEPYGGWDGGGRNLTGHIAGHHLSAVSLIWAAPGGVRVKQTAAYTA